MKNYTDVIIGFGKGGKTLAGKLAASGHQVALIEASKRMYGGTCINVACIPSKFLENNARLSMAKGGSFEEKAAFYKQVIAEKKQFIAALREKNYQKIAGSVDVIDGHASFIDSHTIQVESSEGTKEIKADRFYINTGARPFVPPIKGLKESRYAYLSETMMDNDRLPKELVIIGGGYIGVEFASYYANFGSSVTVLLDGKDFLPREDQEVVALVEQSFEKRGIKLLREAKAEEIIDEEQHALVKVNVKGEDIVLSADAILTATGRRPNVEGLRLENAGVELTERKAVKVDQTLKTTAENIWAMGDVTGGLQFTYISLDDSRIVASQLMGDHQRTTENRGNIPTSIFIDPPFSRVGLSEKEALAAGYKIKAARMQAMAIPKAKVLKQTDGMLKMIINAETDQILGAHFFCAESHELINLVKLAMDSGLPYQTLRDNIYTHPTMSEGLNDLLSNVQ